MLLLRTKHQHVRIYSSFLLQQPLAPCMYIVTQVLGWWKMTQYVAWCTLNEADLSWYPECVKSCDNCLTPSDHLISSLHPGTLGWMNMMQQSTRQHACMVTHPTGASMSRTTCTKVCPRRICSSVERRFW